MIAMRERGKVQVNIAQIKEVVKCINEIVGEKTEQKNLFYRWVRNDFSDHKMRCGTEVKWITMGWALAAFFCFVAWMIILKV